MTSDQCLSEAKKNLGGSDIFDEIYADALAEAKLQADGDPTRAEFLLPNILKNGIEDLELNSQRKAKQLFYMMESINNLTRQVDSFVEQGKSSYDALKETLQANYDTARNEADEALKTFHQEIDANKLGQYLDNKDNRIKISKEISELNKAKGQRGITGDKEAQKIAEIYERYIQSARSIMLKLGVPIANLEGRIFRQIFSREILTNIDKDKFISDMLPRVDDYRTFKRTNVSDAEKRKYIGDYYDDVVSGRIQDIEPNTFDASIQKKTYSQKQSEHRYLHLKGADDVIHSIDQYTNFDFKEIMEAAIRETHFNKALIQANGVNPKFTFDKLRSHVIDKYGKKDPKSQIKITNGTFLKMIYRVGTKDYGDVEFSPFLANLEEIMVNFTRLVFLGGAGIASTGDIGTATIAAQKIGASKLIFTAKTVQTIMSSIKNLPIEEQRGIMAGVEMSTAYAVSSFGNIAARPDAMGRIAKGSSYLVNKMFQYNGLNFVTQTMKTASAMNFKAQMNVYAQTKWGDLNKGFRYNLMRGGILPEEWEIVTANADMLKRNFLGNDYIDPYKLYELPNSAFDKVVGAVRTNERYETIRDNVRQKLMRAVSGFADEAVPTASVNQRAIMYGGSAPGTVGRLVFSNMTNLLSYPLTYMSKVAYRNFESTSGVGSAVSMAGYMLATSLFYGAIADYLTNLNKGRVRDYEGILDDLSQFKLSGDSQAGQFLVESSLKGGFGGIVASTIADYAMYDRSPTELVDAPSLGIFGDTSLSIKKIITESIDGDYNKAMAETVDVVTNLLPAEFPIAGAAYYNMIYFPMMDMLDPAKIDRLKKNWEERSGGEYFILPE